MGAEEKLAFGICGLGFMGRTHFFHLREHPRARVAAVFDESPRRRNGDWSDSIGNLPSRSSGRVDMAGVHVCASLDELLKDASLDVVAITLPTSLHADVTVAALAAGKHVICEKPMALNLADCDRMLRAARRANRTLMIAHCIRFWPQYEAIKALVDQGAIGAVRFAKLARLASPPGYSKGNWLMDSARSGGALLDLHVHDVDFAQHLLGVPNTIEARGSSGVSGGIDHVVATYGYSDGRYALIEGGWCFHAPWPFEMAITVHGETGTLEWRMTGGADVLHYAGGEQPRRIAVENDTGWSREMDYFIESVRAGRQVRRCRPISSRVSIALALLERRSIARSRRIAVPDSLRRYGTNR